MKRTIAWWATLASALTLLACQREIIDVDGPDDEDDIDACTSASPPPFDGCGTPGVPCSSRADCCGGRCEPTERGLVCLGACFPNGTPCNGATDCCSYACVSGVCGTGLCVSIGQPCARDSDCCEGECDVGSRVCVAPGGVTCLGTGEECPASSACCNGACVGDRCDMGQGPCRVDDSPCSLGADCCSGTCTAGACAAVACTGT
jgi:hypothetical protein